MRTRGGEGVNKSENFADVINGWPLREFGTLFRTIFGPVFGTVLNRAPALVVLSASAAITAVAGVVVAGSGTASSPSLVIPVSVEFSMTGTTSVKWSCSSSTGRGGSSLLSLVDPPLRRKALLNFEFRALLSEP